MGRGGGGIQAPAGSEGYQPSANNPYFGGGGPRNSERGEGGTNPNNIRRAYQYDIDQGNFTPKPPPDPNAGMTDMFNAFLAGQHGGGGGHSPSAPSGPSYAEQMAEQARIEGLNNRDRMYGSYLDAAESATNYINETIAQEQSNAALMGVDYEINDEIKTNRINNYFATIWGESDQNELEGLFTRYGKPKGFSGYAVTRGDAEAGAGEVPESEAETASETVKIPGTIIDEEEETLDEASILGG